jgi:hypothetical protein
MQKDNTNTRNCRGTTVPHWTRCCQNIGTGLMVLALIITLAFTVLYRHCWVHADMPLGSIDAIAVDKRGQVYTHSQVTDCIRVYTERGEYIRGFSVPRGGFRIGDDHTIRMYTAQNVISYTLDGVIIGKERYVRATHQTELQDRPSNEVMDTAGNTYRIMPWSAVWPRVEMISVDGRREVVISQPFWLWSIQWPCPAFIYFFCGACLFWIGYFTGRKYKNTVASEECNKSGNLSQ